MSIPLSCTCGRNFRIKDELAGKRIRCPECQTILSVPELEEEPVEVAAGAPDPEPEPEAPMVRRLTPPARSAPPKKKKKKWPWDEVEPRRSSPATDEGWFGRTNAGVLGGLLMIVIAIVWFAIGELVLNVTFLYPPILLIIGVIAMVKGFFTSSS